MKVSELIDELKALPQDADVKVHVEEQDVIYPVTGASFQNDRVLVHTDDPESDDEG